MLFISYLNPQFGFYDIAGVDVTTGQGFQMPNAHTRAVTEIIRFDDVNYISASLDG
jgi:hypothetical protein